MTLNEHDFHAACLCITLNHAFVKKRRRGPLMYCSGAQPKSSDPRVFLLVELWVRMACVCKCVYGCEERVSVSESSQQIATGPYKFCTVNPCGSTDSFYSSHKDQRWKSQSGPVNSSQRENMSRQTVSGFYLRPLRCNYVLVLLYSNVEWWSLTENHTGTVYVIKTAVVFFLICGHFDILNHWRGIKNEKAVQCYEVIWWKSWVPPSLCS